MSPWSLILSGWMAVALLMVALWFIQRRTGNAGIVDIAWSAGVGLLAVWFAWGADGLGGRRMLVATLAILWSCRLAAHLIQRLFSEAEDGRYRKMREQWGNRTQRYLFGFFQVQAFWAVLFALPMWLACRNSEELGWMDAVGVLILVAAVAGEAVADQQLANFKADPENQGKVCQQGLWHYSRHPNYFFEWLHWWTYVFIGWHGPLGWLTLTGPLVMYLFLTKVTGIPPTEEHAVESRGAAYRRYQRTTSPLFPWRPKAEGP
jgi:steroid 5-alpha reductase family enzyme